MSIAEIVAIAVACLTAIGLIGTWIRNSRQDLRQRTHLETNLKAEIKDVKDDIKHPEYGLSAINNKLDEQLLYCAKTSTSLKERVTALENKPRRKKAQ